MLGYFIRVKAGVKITLPVYNGLTGENLQQVADSVIRARDKVVG